MLYEVITLPPVVGMMTGLGFLKLYGYVLKMRESRLLMNLEGVGADNRPFNIFKQIERAEWDTLMFFYGIILCVGGLGTIGYLAVGSELLYGDLGPTTANVLIGLISAVVDNIRITSYNVCYTKLLRCVGCACDSGSDRYRIREYS